MRAQMAVAVAIGIGLLAFWGSTSAPAVELTAAAQAQNEHHSQVPAAPPAGAETPAPGSMRAKMMTDGMMAADARLEKLVKEMNEANGPAKTDAIAAVVTELVEQHRAMRGMMAGHMASMKGMMNRPDK